MCLISTVYHFSGPFHNRILTPCFSLCANQRAAQVLWAQLDTERKEQHISCVELFYRLHCLAPSTAICEDIICMALLSRDKVQYYSIRLAAINGLARLNCVQCK